MPIFGIGLHLIIAACFAFHAIRSGQPLFWLIILFSFPLIGSLVYFLAVWLPDSRLQLGARRAVAAAARSLDPGRELREARAAFDYTPTAQNQLRLAAALLDSEQPEQAARFYQACLKGPFADDLEIRYGAARAFVESQGYADAITHLEHIRRQDPAFRAEALSLLLARAYAGAGRNAQAREEYQSAVERFGTFEVRAEFVIWALAAGEHAIAEAQQAELDQITRRWSRSARELNRPALRRLEAARTLARKRA